MILLRSVFLLALSGAAIWYFLAEPDRKTALAERVQALQSEADRRQDALTDQIEEAGLAAAMIARSAPVAAILAEPPEPPARPETAPNPFSGLAPFGPAEPETTGSPDVMAEELAAAELQSLEALTGLESVRILKSGEGETIPVFAPRAGLLSDGVWQAAVGKAFSGMAETAAYRDPQGVPSLALFSPVFKGGDVPAIVIAEARLAGLPERWEESDFGLTLKAADGDIILSNARTPSGPQVEVTREIPALGATMTATAAQPEPFGPWAMRSGAAGVLAILLAFLLEMTLSRGRLRSELAELRRELEATPPEEVVLESSSKSRRYKEDLATGESLALLGQVSESVAQEINRPLSAIRNHAEAVSRALEKGEMDTARVNTRSVSALADRITRIVANMRGFAPAQAYQIEPVSIRPVVHEAAVSMLERDPALGDFFFMEVAEDVPEKAFVRADKTRLSQVLESMLASSWDACREQEQPELVISIQQSRKSMTVAIDYTGAPDEEFGSEAKRVSVGAVAEASGPVGKGVSFSIARSIVEGMGGRLAFKASGLGGGRTEITLPKFRAGAA